MTTGEPATLPERSRYLVLIAAPPTIWMAHFLVSYVTAALWCAPAGTRARDIEPIHVVIAAYTAVALGGIAAAGWSGYQRHALGAAATPHDADTPADRHRFLGLATLLLAGLSAVATLFSAIAVTFFDTCY